MYLCQEYQIKLIDGYIYIDNQSHNYSLLAVQGPKADSILRKIGYNTEQDFFTIKETKLKYLHTGLIKEIPRKKTDKTALRHSYGKINRSLCVKKLFEKLKQDKIIS